MLKNTNIKDYITVATAHNLGFNHNLWGDFIAEADKGMTIKDYTIAKNNYQSALDTKPTESYPKQKLLLGLKYPNRVEC